MDFWGSALAHEGSRGAVGAGLPDVGESGRVCLA